MCLPLLKQTLQCMKVWLQTAHDGLPDCLLLGTMLFLAITVVAMCTGNIACTCCTQLLALVGNIHYLLWFCTHNICHVLLASHYICICKQHEQAYSSKAAYFGSIQELLALFTLDSLGDRLCLGRCNAWHWLGNWRSVSLDLRGDAICLWQSVAHWVVCAAGTASLMDI